MLDLGKVLFIDSSGLGALISCLKTIKGLEGELVLCRISNPVNNIFKIIQMNHVFDIFNTKKDAVESYKSYYSRPNIMLMSFQGLKYFVW